MSSHKRKRCIAVGCKAKAGGRFCSTHYAKLKAQGPPQIRPEEIIPGLIVPAPVADEIRFRAAAAKTEVMSEVVQALSEWHRSKLEEIQGRTLRDRWFQANPWAQRSDYQGFSG